MKTTLELPDDLMRAVKMRAAATDRKLKDVVAEAIATGLVAANEAVGRKTATSRNRAQPDPLMEALAAAGDAMQAAGVDFEEWAKHSRDVWR